jgi:hypothetical protein
MAKRAAVIVALAVALVPAVASADPPSAAPSAGPSLLGPALVTGGGAVALGVAAGLRVSANADADALRDSCATCDPSQVSSIGVRNTTSEVLMLAGGAAVVGGLGWLAVTLLSRSEARGNTARVVPSAAGVGVAF